MAWHEISWMVAIDVARAMIVGRYPILSFNSDYFYLRIKLKPIQLGMIFLLHAASLLKPKEDFFSLTTYPPSVSIACAKIDWKACRLTTSFVYIHFIHRNFYALLL